MRLFKLEQSDLTYRADFAIYAIGIVLTTLLLLRFAPNQHLLRTASLCLCGLFSWTLIEYLLHRFVLHGLQPFARWHASHHARPMALICTPTILSAALVLLLFCVPSMLLFGWINGGALTLGLVIGYFGYAVVHHAMHHWKAEDAWLRRRKVSHAVHHHVGSPICFGVTTDFWDRVFQTGHRRRVAVSTR